MSKEPRLIIGLFGGLSLMTIGFILTSLNILTPYILALPIIGFSIAFLSQFLIFKERGKREILMEDW